jgi:hypothetical protein
MTDTPKHIKELQLYIWMKKTPEERLLQFITDNDIMFKALRKFKLEKGEKDINAIAEQPRLTT